MTSDLKITGKEIEKEITKKEKEVKNLKKIK